MGISTGLNYCLLLSLGTLVSDGNMKANTQREGLHVKVSSDLSGSVFEVFDLISNRESPSTSERKPRETATASNVLRVS